MKRKVLISTNNNPNYKFYIPIVEFAWNKLGWDVVLLKTEDTKDILINSETTEVYDIPKEEGIRSSTMAQCSRFFASDILDHEDLLQINDIDVIPLTNFWQPNENEFTIFGHDTTGYGYIPIHYATAKVNKWHELMKCTGNFYEDLMREINISKDAYSKEWEKYWFADWDLFTKRCNEDASRFTFIERGLVHIAKDVTAKSRIDRYDYERTINQPEIIDIHCHNDNVTRKENIEMIKQCLLKYFGEVPAWFNEYVEYYKLEYQAL